MIANNIFKAIGDFCQNILFVPYDNTRFMDNWWVQNMVSWIFVAIGFIGFFYWIGELSKHKKAGEE
ncbi:MAG: uracil phosphoribosyltransferase [Lutibacter sp.]|nr:uracil phosphoribosyltransferase [Lutibacter sp.]